LRAWTWLADGGRCHPTGGWADELLWLTYDVGRDARANFFHHPAHSG
jgi:hypothetical protein